MDRGYHTGYHTNNYNNNTRARVYRQPPSPPPPSPSAPQQRMQQVRQREQEEETRNMRQVFEKRRRDEQMQALCDLLELARNGPSRLRSTADARSPGVGGVGTVEQYGYVGQ